MFGETAASPLVQKFVPSVTGKKREAILFLCGDE
jgi:hypothetical protein